MQGQDLYPVQDERSFFGNVLDTIRDRAAQAGEAMMVTGVSAAVLAACTSGSANKADQTEGPTIDSGVCATATLDPTIGANAVAFKPNAYLSIAKEDVKDSTTAVTYIAQEIESPLGKEIDPRSLAAAMAVITGPATSKEGVNVDYNYTSSYQAYVSKYSAKEGGLETARNDCKKDVDVLRQLVSYKQDWAGPNDVLTRFDAVRAVGKGNQITDTMVLTKIVPTESMSGTLITFNSSAKDIQHFNEVFIDDDGNMYVKGAPRPEQGASASASASPSPEAGPVGDGGSTSGDASNGSEGSNGTTGSGTGTGRTSGGGSNSGNNSGSGNGSGSGSGSGGGSGQGGGSGSGGGTGGGSGSGGGTGGGTGGGSGGGSGGGGGGGGGTPPSSTPPSSPPSSTPPSTPPTKGSQPPCVSNPPYVICP